MLSFREQLPVYHPAFLARQAVRADLALQRFPRAYSALLARGTAILGDPHPQLLEWLRYERIDLSEIMTWEWIPVWPFETLATRCKILSVDILKVDCEGFDCEVLNGLMD